MAPTIDKYEAARIAAREALTGARPEALTDRRRAAMRGARTLRHGREAEAPPPPRNLEIEAELGLDVELGLDAAHASKHAHGYEPTGLPAEILNSAHGTHPMVRAFLARFFLVLACILGSVALVNRAVDPLGVWGAPDIHNAMDTDRAQKMALLRSFKQLPEVVLLGDSRMQKYNPAQITRATGLSAFNASISGSNLIDQRVMTGYLAARTPKGHVMPHIVYGIGPSEFRDQPSGANMLHYPALAKQLRGPQRFTGELKTKWAPLIELPTLKASEQTVVHALFGGNSDDDSTQSSGSTDSVDAQTNLGAPPVFARNGYLENGYDDRILKHGHTSPRRWKREAAQFTTFYGAHQYTATEGVNSALPQAARSEFETLLKTANDHGDAPTIFLTPMAPSLAAKLNPLGRKQLTRDVLQYMQSLHKQYHFQLLNYQKISSFDGNSSAWYDGAHPMTRNTKLVMAQLLHDAPAAGDTVLAGK